MKKINLNGQYQLYTYDYRTSPREPQEVSGDFIHAEVPGNVELDYVRAGIFDDLFYGENYKQAETLEWKDFWYVKKFNFDEEVTDTDVYLCFDGVDTVAEYFLNGTLIGSSNNMFIGSRFPVQGILCRGENTLAVHIRSVMAYAKQFDIRPLLTVDEGYSSFVVEDIRRKYSKMLYEGATTFWETELGWQDFDGPGSLCHGWSAIPAYYLSILA